MYGLSDLFNRFFWGIKEVCVLIVFSVNIKMVWGVVNVILGNIMLLIILFVKFCIVFGFMLGIIK